MKVSQNIIKKSDEVYFFEVDIQDPEELHELHYDLPFLLVRMKIWKFEKLFTILHDKDKYVIHVRNLKQALSFEKLHRVVKINQKAWLKPYIDMNTELRKRLMTS